MYELRREREENRSVSYGYGLDLDAMISMVMTSERTTGWFVVEAEKAPDGTRRVVRRFSTLGWTRTALSAGERER